MYLNEDWERSEGGALRCYAREDESTHPVGCNEGDLQVGWLNDTQPVFRSSGSLYTCSSAADGKRDVLAAFETRRQRPNLFAAAAAFAKGAPAESTPERDGRIRLRCPKGCFRQITTDAPEQTEPFHVDVLPTGGTLVLFEYATGLLELNAASHGHNG